VTPANAKQPAGRTHARLRRARGPTLLALLGACAAAAASPVAPLPAEEHTVSATQIAPGIYCFVEDSPSGIVSGNVTLIVGSKRALVVDSGHVPVIAETIIRAIRTLTEKPVAYLLQTHWHMDHVMATGSYDAAFPGLVVISHEFTAEMTKLTSPLYVTEGPRLAAEDVERLRAQLLRSENRDGTPWTEGQRQRAASTLGRALQWSSEFSRMRYRAPDVTFGDGLTIDLGERAVKIVHFGRGNTAGDAVALVPEVGVAIVGDILVYPVPYAYGSYISEWQAVLSRIAALGARAIVPGHGPVMYDLRYLERVRGLLAVIDAETRKVWRPGMPLAELSAKVDLAEIRDSFCRGDRVLEATFDSSTAAAIDRAAQELAGELRPEASDLMKRLEPPASNH
jgi:cyclase